MRVEYKQQTLPGDANYDVDLKKSTFHLWMPNIFEFKGGIQVYSAFLLQALQDIYPQANYQVFLKHDTRTGEDIAFLPQTRFHFSGKWSDRWRTLMFAIQLLIWGIWQRPQLIMATHLNFTLVAYWLKRFTGIPYWTFAYGIDAWNITNSQTKRALQQADRILVISNYTRDRLLAEQNLDPDRLRLLPCTFDVDRWQISPKPEYLLKRHNLTPTQPVVLTVARLSSDEQYKGYDRIIESLPQIRASIPDVHYIIVGKGDDRERLLKSIEQNDLQDCVTLTGFVADEELAAYYQLCDLFAMPSKQEGFGIVYLEAMACGKPVLAGNQDGGVDALHNGELGLLVDPENHQQIAEKIIEVFQGNCPNSLVYRPEALRKKVIEIFGFARFQKTLSLHLNNYYHQSEK